MAPQHVGFDEIREDEPLVDLTEELFRALDAFDVRLGRKRLVDVKAGEDVADLPDPVHLAPRLAYEGQIVRATWLEREVMAVRGPHVVSRLTGERSSDHTADGVLSGQDVTSGPAAFV